MAEASFFPVPSQQSLREAYVGKTLNDEDIPLPSAILDVSRIKHNCGLMLDAVRELNLKFRAHVKTHKTIELTRLQVGEDCKDVRLVVSTVAEAEFMMPLLKDYQSRGAKVNLLYGLPIAPSKVPRLAAVASQLGPGSVSTMMDNGAQLSSIKRFKELTGSPLHVFIKTDSGYHRAGLPPTSDPMIELVKLVNQVESQGDLQLQGFYSHNSLSYQGNNPDDAMAMLKVEIDVCRQAAAHLSSLSTARRESPLVISVGASPTALSVQNILPSNSTATPTGTTSTAQSLLSTIKNPETHPIPFETPFELEIHAGVYPIFDLQQVAASSREFPSILSAHNNQALTILAEVISLYPDRTSEPEALISAGTIALAREPCKSYDGWGVVTAWNMPKGYTEYDSVDLDKRLVVKRVSQEHGILGWQNEGKNDDLPVAAGDRVRLWINHACITSVPYGWYLIVDSDKARGHERDITVEDVWVKCRGW